MKGEPTSVIQRSALGSIGTGREPGGSARLARAASHVRKGECIAAEWRRRAGEDGWKIALTSLIRC
jgi:hypothetical protein